MDARLEYDLLNVKRSLDDAGVPEGDHEGAVIALAGCGLGAKLIELYKEVHNFVDERDVGQIVEDYVEIRVDAENEYVEGQDYGDSYGEKLDIASYEHRLPELLDGVDLKGVDIDAISQHIYLNFDMVKSHQLASPLKGCLDCFSVGETEVYISYQEVLKQTGITLTPDMARGLGLKYCDDTSFTDFNLSDVVWCCVIDYEQLAEFIDSENG